MSSTTITPTSTVANGTSSIGGGAGSRHAAVSDDSDTTYVDITGVYPTITTFGFTTPTGLPSGSVILAGLLQIRAASATSNQYVGIGEGLNVGGTTANDSLTVGTDIITAYTLGASGDGASILASFWRTATNATLRLYEVKLVVYYISPPVVTVSAPTGTLTDQNDPTVSWSSTFDSLAPQQAAYEVKIFDDGTYGGGGFDPSTSTPYVQSSVTDLSYTPVATSWQSPRLANDTYRAYVRTAESYGGVLYWSAWSYSGFVINVTPPDAPAFTLTDQPSSLRVKIDVTPDNSPVTTDGVLLERSIDGGTTYEEVESTESGSPFTVYDYFAPSGISVSYRASGWNDTSSGRLYSAYTTHTITPATGWRIVHPTDPTLSFAIDDRPDSYLRSNQTIQKAARQSISQPLGRSTAVAISDTRGPDTGSITFLSVFDKLAELDATLDSGASAFWLAGRDQDGWRDRWVVFGDQETSRVIDKSFFDGFDVTLPWTEVEHEDG